MGEEQRRWHVRVFGASTVTLGPGGHEWRGRNMGGPFWRLYSNDRDGAALLLPRGPDGVEEVPLRAGAVCLIPAGVNFHAQVTDTVGHFFAHFEVVGVPRAATSGPFSRPVPLPDAPHLGAIISALRGPSAFRPSAAPGTPEDALRQARELRLSALVHEALALALLSLPEEERARCVGAAPGQEAVRPALEHIERNLGERLSVSELAALCCLSEDYFIRRFRECVGVTPAQYVREQRVSAAALRLIFTDDPIERIVGDTGFGSRHYFTRVFKEHTGRSPAAYRKRGLA